jgi:L-serine deaminase
LLTDSVGDQIAKKKQSTTTAMLRKNKKKKQHKKMTMISKSRTVRGFGIGGGTAGVVDANGVTTTTTQHTITGGLELERCKCKSTWPGLAWVCGLELEQAVDTYT